LLQVQQQATVSKIGCLYEMVQVTELCHHVSFLGHAIAQMLAMFWACSMNKYQLRFSDLAFLLRLLCTAQLEIRLQ